MAGPSFMIIGAMKCGTSTLAAQLGAQAGVFMTTPKEPNFFSDDEVYAKGMGWYNALFDTAAPGDLLGEGSTHYTKLPTYPKTLERIVAAGLSPKLIYMIRNPIDRAVSHYIHEWTQGVMSGDIDGAFDAHPALIAYSSYAMQIAPFVQHFGADQIMVTSQEALRADPQAVLSSAGQFLELEHPPTWQSEQAAVNVSAERVRRLPLHGLLVDNPLATALRRNLIPQSLRDRIRKSRQMDTRPSLSDDRRAMLEGIFRDDYAQMQTFFPDADLSASYPFVTS